MLRLDESMLQKGPTGRNQPFQLLWRKEYFTGNIRAISHAKMSILPPRNEQLTKRGLVLL
jgi:hypothetical protein